MRPTKHYCFGRKKQIDYQFAPSITHRRNALDRAIRKIKNHFISGLSWNDKLFPMYLWYRLLDQAQITLNMLSNSRRNSKISANAMMEGNFDFNKKISTTRHQGHN